MGGEGVTDYISTDELAAWMGIPDAADDSRMASSISAASAAIDQWCDRAPAGLGPRGFTPDSAATARIYKANWSDGWTIETHDFWDTASLVVQTDSGDNGTYDSTWTVTRDYVPGPFDASADGRPYYKIFATGGRYFPSSGIGSGMRPRVQVTAKWGWPAVPDAVIEACYLKAARLTRRWQSPEGAGGFTAAGFAAPLVKINTREDPDVIGLLAPYCRLGAIVG